RPGGVRVGGWLRRRRGGWPPIGFRPPDLDLTTGPGAGQAPGPVVRPARATEPPPQAIGLPGRYCTPGRPGCAERRLAFLFALSAHRGACPIANPERRRWNVHVEYTE